MRIMSMIEYPFINNNKKKMTNYKVNKSNLLQGIYDKLILGILYKKTINAIVKRIIDNYIVLFYVDPKERHFKRVCKTPRCFFFKKKH